MTERCWLENENDCEFWVWRWGGDSGAYPECLGSARNAYEFIVANTDPCNLDDGDMSSLVAHLSGAKPGEPFIWNEFGSISIDSTSVHGDHFADSCEGCGRIDGGFCPSHCPEFIRSRLLCCVTGCHRTPAQDYKETEFEYCSHHNAIHERTEFEKGTTLMFRNGGRAISKEENARRVQEAFAEAQDELNAITDGSCCISFIKKATRWAILIGEGAGGGSTGIRDEYKQHIGWRYYRARRALASMMDRRKP